MTQQYLTTSRLGKALAALALGLTVATGAQAADQVVLRVAHFLPATSSAQVNLIQPWCNKIAQESNQRMVCQIYPAMQLGGTPAQLFDQAKDGVADIVWTVPTYAAGRFVKSEVFELPWIAVKAEAGSQALWEYVHQYSMDEFKGVHPIFMHLHDGALFHFSSKQPRTLEDLKGLKIRAATRSNSRTIEALGAVPVQMPMPAVPEALSKGVVDGVTVPWESAPAIKLSEISNYHFDVPEGAPRLSNTIFLFGMNQARYDSLPADLKKIIDDNSGLKASAWAGRVGFDEIIPKFKEQAKAAGNRFYNMPDSEYRRFVEATQGVSKDWIKTVDAKGGNGAELLAAARNMIKEHAASGQ
ncbi:TRAP transporter substrate-binding protein [Castellaniella sp. MT123]|uniref:TRAP transporter substrate-binding protein n=1 Tax=Castellaniella sp. MT123 TaxID=3140381 RepID=UPI0031F45D1E